MRAEATSADRPTEPAGVVRQMARPPIRQSILVRSGTEHTFDVFVRELGSWWPLDPFSFGTDRIRKITFERFAGGRVYETWDDGREVDWGEVLEWDPPKVFTMSWTVTGAPTMVTLSFSALAPELTRVQLVHSGWEHLSEAELGEDCALPGGYLNGSFTKGWAVILSRFLSAAESRPVDDSASA